VGNAVDDRTFYEAHFNHLLANRARDKYKVLEAQARALVKSTNMAFDDAFAHVIAEIGGD
jgi:hypothetical protein